MSVSKIPVSTEVADLISTSMVWDNHGCMPLRPDDYSFLPRLQQYRDAGVNVAFINAGFDLMSWENTVAMLASFRHWIGAHPDDYCFADSVVNIEKAISENKLAVGFDIEGGVSLNGQLSMVELYYELGVRWMLIAYNNNNLLGGGCQDDDPGLSDFGRRVIDEMERLGMVVCCSHTGYQTTMEVMEYANNPVIFSHSNPLALWQHKRNIRDDAIKACADSGGVIGINGLGSFLGKNDSSTQTFVRHIDYVAQLVGPRHVGLGLDYVFDMEELDEFTLNNPKMFPPEEGYGTGENFVQPAQVPEIAAELLNLGYSTGDVQAILGENHMRIAKQVWK